MKIKFISVFIAILSICNSSVNAGDSLNVYKIINPEFKVLLDSFIVNAKQYGDFKNIIVVSIMNNDGDIMEITYDNYSDKLSFYPDVLERYRIGIAFYDSIIITLSGRGEIIRKIMKKTDCKIKVDIKQRKMQKHTGEYVFPITWLVHFKDEKLKIIRKYDRSDEE